MGDQFESRAQLGRRSALLCSVALYVILPSAATAQTGASTATNVAEDRGVLEEVVVTAERREANVQDIPIAMTVVTGEQLNDKAVRRVEDMQFATPALSIAPTGLVSNVNIRGVGLASGNPSVTNGVATYVDGLFQPPIVGNNSFYDIADVQVLRGPQGTFVGSSSTGGAIFVNSRNPTPGQTNGYAQVELGNYARKGVQAALNLPIGDTLALRGALNYAKRNSYYNDRGVFHNDAGSLDELAGRVGALWQPTDAFQALLKVELADKDTDGFAYRPIPTTLFSAGRVGGIRELSYDSATRNTERAKQFGLELKYRLDGGITLRSLSGYQDKRAIYLIDTDATAIPPARLTDQKIRERELSQEINVISPTEDRLSWVVGGYYQRNKIDVLNLLYVGTGFPQRQYIPNEKTTRGYFGQLSLKVTDSFDAQLGLRHTSFLGEQLPGAGVFINFTAPATPSGVRVADLAGSHRDTGTTGKFNLNWHLSEDDLLYAFVARGYKPGGFNSVSSQFDPETVIDVEMGWKSSFWGGRGRSSINAFHYDYQGFQTGVVDLSSGTTNVTNLADATIQGIELEGQFLLGRVRVDGGFAYVDSELASLSFVNTRLLPGGNLGPQCATGQTTGCFNYTPFIVTNNGGVNLYSPKTSFNVGVEYGWPLSNGSKLTPRLNYGYVGSQYTNLLYSQTTDLLRSRGLLSALLTYDQGDWNLQLYGSNLADRDYVAGQSGNNEIYGAPREFGLRAYYKFD